MEGHEEALLRNQESWLVAAEAGILEYGVFFLGNILAE